jgi:hypothetical protein
MNRPTKRPIYRTYYGETIKKIYEKFVGPAITQLLVHAEEASFHEGLKRFFHEDTRTVLSRSQAKSGSGGTPVTKVTARAREKLYRATT